MNDLILRQAAIAEVKEAYENDEMLDGYEYRLQEIPPAQSEQADCEYCHEDSDGYVKPIEKNAHAFVRFGMDGWELSLQAKGWHGSAKIWFCPMCGRRLTDG